MSPWPTNLQVPGSPHHSDSWHQAREPAEVTASDPEMEDHEDPDEEAPTLLSGGVRQRCCALLRPALHFACRQMGYAQPHWSGAIAVVLDLPGNLPRVIYRCSSSLLLMVVTNPNLQAMSQKMNEAVLLHRMNRGQVGVLRQTNFFSFPPSLQIEMEAVTKCLPLRPASITSTGVVELGLVRHECGSYRNVASVSAPMVEVLGTFQARGFVLCGVQVLLPDDISELYPSKLWKVGANLGGDEATGRC